ncbi:MAG TPA: PIG-L family deacetylase [Blastocatellia bacterium]|nr:PIG-L family deacetylase [Blastocatellia bacterium]
MTRTGAVVRILLTLFAFQSAAFAQELKAPPRIAPDERFKADILVIVAHPDDETMITGYLARAIYDQHKRVAVIYGTRGDGGGNTVGEEQAAALGAVREIEARRACAALGIMNVWFLNGPDTPGQDVLRSLETWHHGTALEQTVRLVRLTRPEVILTWLPDYVVGENHDDHQAAGVIATEAFDLACDPTAFPEQVAPPRNRLNISNLTEGLRLWQPKKLYYFTDASHLEFVEGRGPQYATTDVSPSRNLPYFRISADEWRHHQTQGEVAEVAKRAIETNDFHELQQPERFIFGKSLVKSSATDDIFAGVTAEAIAFAPVRGYRPQERAGINVELGGPWAFYREFWRAHSIEQIAQLLAPEAGGQLGSPLVVPLILRNDTGEAKEVRLSTMLPDGWTERARFNLFTIPAHETYPLQVAVVPAGQAKQWQEVTWKVEAAGAQPATLKLRVFTTGGGLPQ